MNTDESMPDVTLVHTWKELALTNSKEAQTKLVDWYDKLQNPATAEQLDVKIAIRAALSEIARANGQTALF